MDIKELMNQLYAAKTESEKQQIELEINSRFESLSEDEKKSVRSAFLESFDDELNETRQALEKVDVAMDLDDISEYVGLSAIATNYFGKSKNWLYQRIRGYMVNGNRASFSDEEKKQLADALQDLSERLKETSLKIA